MGKLIVIEGTDGSGKSTQFKLLTERCAKEGKEFRNLVFPRYSEPSSALIRMYLGGEFGLCSFCILCRRSFCLLQAGLGAVVRKRRSDPLRPVYHLQRRPSNLEGAAGEPQYLLEMAL